MVRTVAAAVIVLAVFASACGGKTSTTPTSPSPTSGGAFQSPNLVGQWFGAGRVTRRDAERGASQQFACEFSLGITSQSGEELSGSSIVNGSGANSDPYCTQNGTFGGRVASDGKVSNLR